MTKLTISPITRIEGHLKIDMDIEGGKAVNAKSTGTMFRSFEILLREEILGVHPRLLSEFVGSARLHMELHQSDPLTVPLL